MRLKPALTLEDAKMMVQACERASAAIGREGTIVIVDAGGHVIYVGRCHLCATSARSTGRDDVSCADHMQV